MFRSPILVVMREALSTSSLEGRKAFLRKAVGQLPSDTQDSYMDLARSMGENVDDVEDALMTNGMGLRLGDDVGHLAVVPEAAVSFMCSSMNL